MDIFTIQEEAYKRGFEAGYADGEIDFAPKWIPVTGRLPEDGQSVLCFKQGKYASCVMTAAFSKCLERFCRADFRGAKHGGFYNYDSEFGYYELREVTHWMPLPEPPKGE